MATLPDDFSARKKKIREQLGEDWEPDDWFPDALAEWMAAVQSPPKDDVPGNMSMTLPAGENIPIGNAVYMDDDGKAQSWGGKGVPIGIHMGIEQIGEDIYGTPILVNRILIRGTSNEPINPDYTPPPIVYPKVSWRMKLRQEWVYWTWKIEEAWKVLWTK